MENAQTNNFYFVSLGCSKNLVDSQIMIGMMKQANAQLVGDASLADIIIVNTCSFIDLAKEESIQTILEMADYKNPSKGKCKGLIVSGCMVQRYSKDLELELPEVDLFIGTGEYQHIVKYIQDWEKGVLKQKSFVDDPRYIHDEYVPLAHTTPFYMAYVKISEGCNRNCTFCIIPTLRGKLRSRSIESIVRECATLAKEGVKEINLISQDLSDYGVDLDIENPLFQLFSTLDTHPDLQSIRWIRPFYYYPDDLSAEMIDLFANAKRVIPYLDMPVQHFSDSVLKRMNRFVTGEKILQKIALLREKIPNIVLRTSVIVGFPGESQEDFDLLKSNIELVGFDHLGVFRYSDEEGTPASKLKPKVDRSTIQKRYKEIYQLQKSIVARNNQKYLGQKLEVLIEGNSSETQLLLQGRFYGQAPDIDGHILINDGFAKIGDFVTVEIQEVLGYDLLGAIS